MVSKKKKKMESKEHVTHFCWLCFEQGTLVTCSNVTCKRSYHLHCVIKLQIVGNDNNWVCPECHVVAEAEKIEHGKPRFEKSFVQTLLNMWFQRLKDFVIIFTNHESPNQKMTFKALEAKINAMEYNSIEAFYSDLTWIYFDCHVLPDMQHYLGHAEELQNFCFYELRRIKRCFECYYKANIGINDGFTEVCFTPHILLWVKVKGYPYWPAKAFNVDAEKEKVLVHFFGDHQNTFVKFENCYLFSQEHPSGKLVETKDFSKAMKQIEKHIKKLRKTFNGFEYAPFRVRYDPTKNNEYLKMMLPNYGFYERTNKTSKLVEALLAGRKPKLMLPEVRVEKLYFPENVKKRRCTIDLNELPDICDKKKARKTEKAKKELIEREKIEKLSKPKIVEEEAKNIERVKNKKPLNKPITIEIIEGKAKNVKRVEVVENHHQEQTKNIKKLENKKSSENLKIDLDKPKIVENHQEKLETKCLCTNYESSYFNDHCYAMNSISYEGNIGGFTRLAILIENLMRFAINNRELQTQILNIQQEHAKEVKNLKETAEQEKFLEIKEYELEIDYLEKKYQKEISDLTQKSEFIRTEIKKHEEERHAKIIRQLQLKHETEKKEAVQKAIANTKLQIWCVSCSNEAKFQCCYSTWYCKPSCQTKDRNRHKQFCRARLPRKFLPPVLNID